MKVGNKIKTKNASWTFDKNVPKTFSKHIEKKILVPFLRIIDKKMKVKIKTIFDMC